MATDDGGPAFPVPDGIVEDAEGRAMGSFGMSLRDYFAAKAMQGLLASGAYNGTAETVQIEGGEVGVRYGDIGDDPHLISDRAYEMTDAMLAARETQR